MNQKGEKCRLVNILYYLYFLRGELVHYVYEEHDEEWHEFYIFRPGAEPDFRMTIEEFGFFVDNKIVEITGGSEMNDTYELTDYYKLLLGEKLKEKQKSPS